MSIRTLNVEKFKTVLKKFTCNNLTEFASLNFTDGNIQTSIRNMNGDVIIINKWPNDVILGINPNEELTMNFTGIPVRIIPTLNAIDEDETPIEIFDDKIWILSGQGNKRKAYLLFDDESVVENFIIRREPLDAIEYFHSMLITEEFLKGDFDKIKKIGARFNKVYLTVDNGILYIETTDKTNLFADGFIIPITEISDVQDMTICYDLSHITALMQIVEDDIDKRFTMNFAWLPEQDRGMIYTNSEDLSERYFLFSREI